MLEKFKQMLKNTFPTKKEDSDDSKPIKGQKKKVENMVILLIILIITIVAINYIWNDQSKENNKDFNTNKVLTDTTITDDTVQVNANTQDNTELKLEETLSRISGVGQTKVMISYSQTTKQVPVYNEDSSSSETEEIDTQGGNRKINQSTQKKELVYKESNGEKEPIIENYIYPKMEGAIILANGANNPDIKAKIIQAVEAVTGLATHKIQVFEMK